MVADDQQVVTDGFAALLETQRDLSVVGTASDGAEAIRICNEHHPDVVLMDTRMPPTDGTTFDLEKTHVSRILRKLWLRDRTQAVIVACETGLVVPHTAPR